MNQKEREEFFRPYKGKPLSEVDSRVDFLLREQNRIEKELDVIRLAIFTGNADNDQHRKFIELNEQKLTIKEKLKRYKG